MAKPKQRKKEKRFFAIASLGKKRWYWVVWPSLEVVKGGDSGRHVADGYAPSKADAADAALEVAGIYGEWLAAKYAQTYHQLLAREKRGEQPVDAALAMIEFLYQDMQDDDTEQWYSVQHRIARKTPKFVYVEQFPYNPEQTTGSWLDDGAPTLRLNRAMLERDGYTLAPNIEIDDPLFFTEPYQARTSAEPACFAKLNLEFPSTIAEVRRAFRQLAKTAHPDRGGDHDEFLALQAAYEMALRLCET